MVKLRVARTSAFDNPKVVKVPRSVLRELDLIDGLLVEISAKERSSIAVLKSMILGKDVIRMSYSMMLTLGVHEGEYADIALRLVDFREVKPCSRLVFRLEEEGTLQYYTPRPAVMLFGMVPIFGVTFDEEKLSFRELVKSMLNTHIKRLMLGWPYVVGDYVVLAPRSSTEKIRLRVIKTEPNPPVYVTNTTILELADNK